MNIQRSITNYLEDFYKSEKSKAVLITGGRQIGKSYSIREFGRRCFKSFVEINFLENKDAVTAFKTAKDTKDLILRISSLTSIPLIEGDTLVFLDEIQVLPDAITAIKFLVEDGRFKYILSGSLLGVELKGIRSVPVGFMSIKEMYPLSIEEFFKACGVNDNIWEKLENCYKNAIEVDSFIHEKMMALFHLYLIVGGMPEVVSTYLETNDIQRVIEKQKEILTLYKEDISQYDKDSKLYIEDIFDLIPSELNNQNKRFILKKLNENIKFKRYEDSFIWLREAGVAIPVYNIESPTLPLELAKLRNLFKLFSNDVGLLASQYADGIQLKILNGDDSINYGAVYENAVAEELLSHGFKLYYFNSKKQGELDFVIKLNDSILPIEVKSGKYYERHNALKNVLENKEYGIKEAIILTNANIKRKESLLYLPIYMVAFIKEKKIEHLLYKIDLANIV